MREYAGRAKISSGKSVPWKWVDGALHMTISSQGLGKLTDEEISEASRKIPKFIWDMHDAYWANPKNWSAAQ
jgi:hypothetical protein